MATAMTHARNRRSWGAVLAGTTLVVGLAGAAPAQAAAPPTSTPITSLPFFGGGDTLGAGTGGPGTAARNAAVSARCNDGRPIAAPQWYSVGKDVTGQIHLRTVAAWAPRSVEILPTGSAIVDHWTGKVIACGSTPLPRRGRAVDVVAYYQQPVPPDEDGLYYSEADLELYVGRTTGHAPANDEVAKARRITSLPFTETVDTSFADDDGPALEHYGEGCIDGTETGQHATVWYRFTAPANGAAPTLTVTAEPTTGWSSGEAPGGAQLQSGVLEVTPDGPVLLGNAADDCSTPAALQAGHTYLIGITSVNDDWNHALLVPGGPIRVTVSAN